MGIGDLLMNSLSFVLIIAKYDYQILSILNLNTIIYQPTMFTRLRGVTKDVSIYPHHIYPNDNTCQGEKNAVVFYLSIIPTF